MSNKIKVTNLRAVKIDHNNSRSIGEVKTGQILGNDNNFHPEGLFSTEVFGPVGSPARNTTFGKINLNLTIMSPIIYKTVIKLKAFYREILEGTTSVEFDNKTGEFVKSTGPKSSTGFSFFLSHIDKLKFEGTGSEERNFNIKLFNQAVKEGSHLTNYLLVLPAGLRDYTIDKNDRPSEDEINTFYRRVLAQATIVDPTRASRTPAVYDGAAIGIQKAVVEIYDYIQTLLDGKNKLILDKWVGRKIFNSTRNVISSHIDKSTNLRDKRTMKYNETLAGIHQYVRATVPKSIFEIKNKYITDIFPENSRSCYLTNVKTLKREEVVSTSMQKEYDLFTSPDGLEKVIANLGNLDIRDLPITLNRGKHYLGLVYRDNKRFKFFQDIDELPEGWDKEKVSPVTLTEFIYMSVYHMDGQYPGFVTRYPIKDYGSIYPTMIRLTTTARTETLIELDDQWNEPDDESYIAANFPIKGVDYFNSQSVHISHLGRLGGDHDGDTVSLTMLLDDESVKEVKNYLNSKKYYISDSGDFYFSSAHDTLDGVFKFIT